MANLQELERFRNIYMIGIGGTSMSGIAEILINLGFNVAGSDVSASATTEKLASHGVHITIGHNPNNLQGCDLVVYTAAVKDDDIELSAAREQGIPTVDRSEFLGMITKAFRDTICVSGTHGKSTTSSMVSMCFLEAALDPSIQIGADLKAIDGNYRIGKSEYLIIEACEYVESFLHFFPKAEIILNIDNDHLDYYRDLDHIKEAFVKFVKLLPDDGLLVYNADDENLRHISANTKARSVSFGIEKSGANFVAKNITFDKNGFATFDVYHNNVFYKTFNLSVPGRHNVLNALSCIALCDTYKIDKNYIKDGLKKFTGAGRRFEYVGEVNGASIFDDYGHHPTELEAVANAAKKRDYNHSWVIFQPHTYSRTRDHLEEFAKVLTNYDNIIVTDIYAAREQNTIGVSSKDIVDLIDQSGRKALYIPDLADVVDYIRRYAEPNDLIITQGAGTITKVAHKLVDDSVSLTSTPVVEQPVATIPECVTEETSQLTINNEEFVEAEPIQENVIEEVSEQPIENQITIENENNVETTTESDELVNPLENRQNNNHNHNHHFNHHNNNRNFNKFKHNKHKRHH